MPSGHLLVVDDEESVAVTMGAILEMDGYTVSISTSGAEALRKLRETTYDLVLTDLRLDDADGLSIVNEVCRIQPDTVSIILTGFASLESAINALREGAYDYLIKPCDVEELRAVVARGVERRQLGAQLKARVADLERANETIRVLNRDLQRRVDDATVELQDLYRDAQAHVLQLQELDRLKSRFLSMASHELKTPLTSVSGLAQVLLRRMRRRIEQGRPSDEEWEQEQLAHVERLELLTSQTARLGRLVDELLDVSRIESGKLEFRWAPVDIVELVREVTNRLQLTTAHHTIDVDIDAMPDAPIPADRDHLEQVLDNLLSNAIKFTPAGGTIRVRVQDAEEALIVSVHDSGVGIPADQVDAVFGLFYQAEDPVSRRTGGMGLGLYISKEIITRHGGRIWAESEPGQGSTFSFALPREQPAGKITEPIGGRQLSGALPGSDPVATRARPSAGESEAEEPNRKRRRTTNRRR